MKKSNFRMNGKALALILAVVLVVGGVVGGTLAWVTAESDTVTNTFTLGDIDIDLDETTGSNYTMIPGNTIGKNPKVTVTAGSEDCWLFVEVVESAGLSHFLSYEIEDGANGWTKLKDGVYYREVSKSEQNQEFYVLKGNQVTVNENVEKTDMNESQYTYPPTLTFKAYAVQKANVATAQAAWDKIAG